MAERMADAPGDRSPGGRSGRSASDTSSSIRARSRSRRLSSTGTEGCFRAALAPMTAAGRVGDRVASIKAATHSARHTPRAPAIRSCSRVQIDSHSGFTPLGAGKEAEGARAVARAPALLLRSCTA